MAQAPRRSSDHRRHGIKESRGERLAHMVLVPEPRAPDLRTATGEAEPAIGWRIRSRRAIAAQKGDRVALDPAAVAARSRFIRHTEPQKRHRADRLADPFLENPLRPSHFGIPQPRLSLCRGGTGTTPGGRQTSAVPERERLPDEPAEDGRPMPPSRRAPCPAVGPQPTPERAPGPGRQGVRSNANDPRSGTGSGALLARLEEKVNAAARPAHPTAALLQAARPGGRGVGRSAAWRRAGPASHAASDRSGDVVPAARSVRPEISWTDPAGVKPETFDVGEEEPLLRAVERWPHHTRRQRPRIRAPRESGWTAPLRGRRSKQAASPRRRRAPGR